MRIASLSTVAALIAAALFTQVPRDDRQDGRPGPPPPPPRDTIFLLFDTDDNGEISMKEIEAAVAILKKRDRDGNGVLTRDELPRPPRPGDERDGDNGRNGGPPPRRGEGGRDGNAQNRVNAPAGTVLFSAGYETNPVDRGRPVSLIAAALGVKPEVFRDAFSRVNPSRGGEPSAALARANKKALMDALGKHGVTNDRLDAVSNYYRYNGRAGEVWKRTPASARAIVRNGKVTGFTITNPGAGYTTPPTVFVAGHGDVRVKATIEFTRDFKTNGRVRTLTVVQDNGSRKPAPRSDTDKPAPARDRRPE